MLWRSDRHADAASVLTQERYPLAGRAWIENVAPTFLEVFGDRPDAAIRAIEPIAARGPKAAEWIGYLADAAARDKKPRIAFELESRCRTSGMEEWETVAAAYAYLEAWKGEAPALAWVQKRVPEDARPIVQMFAHSYDAGELTWTLESTPRDDATRDYLWLLRALAIARDPALASKRAEALSYFRATTSKSYYVTAARYLLGQADLKDVLALGNTPKRRCELYYYIGARAEAEAASGRRGRLVRHERDDRPVAQRRVALGERPALRVAGAGTSPRSACDQAGGKLVNERGPRSLGGRFEND